ncbi:hypothetical protein [Rosistilla oblonga]|uniref:hypothetical protein n=1 Tax=Rosistilla oblonga TaxID=2527990 RepID=UPI003A984AF8
MSGSAAPIAWRHLFHTIRVYLPLWAGATILFAGLGYAYTRVRVDTYSASQSLVIRNEAHGEQDLLGRFASQTDLKAAQETVLELSNNRNVLMAALTRLDPELAELENGPSQDFIADARSRIIVRPPKGSEFGATEVIYLETRETTQERAEKLCNYVREALTNAMRDIRADRFSGVIQELTHSRDLAAAHRQEANKKLQALETSVGSDLGELRSLTENFAGSGNSQRVLTDLQKESQQAELELEKLRELEALLKRGQADPDQLLVSGGELLASQPTLKRLKDGYTDAQLAASSLSSLYTANHPKMRAAETAQREILDKILQEIQASIESMEPQIRIASDRVAKLQKKQDELSNRLNELAEMRTTYSNLLSDFGHRTNLLERAEASLNEAEASRQAALSIDLISPLGPVQSGDKPVGPNDTMLLMGSITAGLLFGAGMVFLVAPGSGKDNFGRRWSDYSGSKFNAAPAAVPAAQPVVASAAQPTVAPPAQPVETAVPAEPATESAPANHAADAWQNLQRLAAQSSQTGPGEPRVERRSNPR